MPTLFRSASLWVMIFLAIPTFLILVTWNTLPGQPLYGVRRGLEEGPRLALHLTGSKSAADYEVTLADRRFSEAISLVRSDKTLGLEELRTSVKTTKNVVVETQNEQARAKFVDNLIAYDQKLETQKETILRENPPTTASKPVPLAPTPSTTPTIPAPATVPTPAPTPAPPSPPGVVATVPPPSETVTSITDTQKEIKEIIDDLKKKDKKDSGVNTEKRGDHSTTGTGIPPNGKVPESGRQIKTYRPNSEGD